MAAPSIECGKDAAFGKLLMNAWARQVGDLPFLVEMWMTAGGFAMSAIHQPTLRGIDGWLGVLACLAVTAPVVTACVLILEISRLGIPNRVTPWLVVLGLTQIIIEGYLANLLLDKRSLFPRLFVRYTAAVLIIRLLFFLAVSAIYGAEVLGIIFG